MNAAVGLRIEPLRPAGFTLAGEHAVCDPAGALHFPALRLLAVSDLHLEKGSSLARRGVLLPPYDTAATLARLGAVIARHAPRIVVSLGDSFHDGEGAARLPGAFREALAGMMAGRDWFWVRGNHDPDAPPGLGGESVAEIALSGLVLRHEPQRAAAPGEIAGHLHPGARIVRRGRSVRRRCFATDGARLIMPAFGAFTGSLNVLDRAFAGLFQRERLTAHMLGEERTYAVPGSQLRPG
jgi:DNA ligase-associated metallophosphoesterase